MFAPRAKRSSQNRGPDRERVQFTTFSLQFTTFSPVGACTQNVLAASLPLPLPLPLTPSQYRPVRRAALRNGSRSRSQCPCAAPTWWLEDRAITAGGLASPLDLPLPGARRGLLAHMGGRSPTWAPTALHPQRCPPSPPRPAKNPRSARSQPKAHCQLVHCSS